MSEQSLDSCLKEINGVCGSGVTPVTLCNASGQVIFTTGNKALIHGHAYTRLTARKFTKDSEKCIIIIITSSEVAAPSEYPTNRLPLRNQGSVQETGRETVCPLNCWSYLDISSLETFNWNTAPILEIGSRFEVVPLQWRIKKTCSVIGSVDRSPVSYGGCWNK